MSCGGCVSNVKRALLQIPEIIEADVQLSSQSAILKMNRIVDVEKLQAQLSKSGLYLIKELD